jgi:ribonuclease HI
MDFIKIYVSATGENPGKGGFAYRIEKENSIVNYSEGFEDTTANRLFILGAISALQSIEGTQQNIYVYSCSLYLSTCLNRNKPMKEEYYQRNNDLVMKLRTEAKRNYVTFARLDKREFKVLKALAKKATGKSEDKGMAERWPSKKTWLDRQLDRALGKD